MIRKKQPGNTFANKGRNVCFHIHSSRSFDSISSPLKIMRKCQTLGIQTVCITDHETIGGSIEAGKIAEALRIQAIIGAEYCTDIGDIIGIFLKNEIKQRNHLAIIREIKAQGGIAILPHPFHGHVLSPELLQAIDLIEVYNCRCTKDQNDKALALALEYQKPMLAGGDVHFISEINNCVMNFISSSILTKSDFFYTKRTWKARPNRLFHTNISQIIKGCKQKDLPLIFSSIKNGLKPAAKDLVQWVKNQESQREWKIP
jgi:predicted metal-dependent phosphoesterase TrpH